MKATNGYITVEINGVDLDAISAQDLSELMSNIEGAINSITLQRFPDIDPGDLKMSLVGISQQEPPPPPAVE